MYFEENQNTNFFINMSKNKKKHPWKWFLALWLGSLFFTAFIVYTLKWLLKRIA